MMSATNGEGDDEGGRMGGGWGGVRCCGGQVTSKL